jgi:hypothetical protein
MPFHESAHITCDILQSSKCWLELQTDQQNMQKRVKDILFERCETVLSNRQLELLQATAAKIVFECGFLFDRFHEENAVAFDAWGVSQAIMFFFIKT